MIRVKICGLTNASDAEAAIDAGADALGFNFERTSPRYVGDSELPWLSVLAPIPIKVAVFGRVDRPVPKGLFDVVQGVEWEVFPEPAPKRIHAIRMRPGQKPQDVIDTLVNANLVILDAFSTSGQWGGTGERVDWDLAAEVVRLSRTPILLAGGLTPDNVAEAVARVRPFGVDVSSGVEERPGVKDIGKVRAFIQAARRASRGVHGLVGVEEARHPPQERVHRRVGSPLETILDGLEERVLGDRGRAREIDEGESETTQARRGDQREERRLGGDAPSKVGEPLGDEIPSGIGAEVTHRPLPGRMPPRRVRTREDRSQDAGRGRLGSPRTGPKVAGDRPCPWKRRRERP